MANDILSYPEDTAVSADEYVATEKNSGGVVLRQRSKPGALKVLPTGGSTARTLAAALGDLDVTAGTATASKALVLDANKDATGVRDLTVRKIIIGDSANDHTITIAGAGDEAANRVLSVPLLGGADTLATLGTAQTFTGAKTFSAVGTFSVGAQSTSTAVTATADGLTTGLITAGTGFVTITSANADHIATLPAPTAGHAIWGWVGANGCELRTVASSNVKINDVDSDGTNEAAIPATTLFMVRAVSATEYILFAWTELGATIAAIVPDAA